MTEPIVPDAEEPRPEAPRAFRASVRIPVKVRVLVEERTFSPFHYDGTCENISASGALVVVRNLFKNDYLTLIQRPRYIRVICPIPGRDIPLTLFGKIVWFDYRGELPDAECKIGVAFEIMKEDATRILQEYLEAVAAQQQSAGS